MRVVLLLLTSLFVVATVLPFIHEPYWWGRVFDFPRVQILTVGLVTLALFLGHTARERGLYRERYDRWIVLLLVLGIGYQMWRIWPYTPLHSVQSVEAEAPRRDQTFRLVITNVLMDNRYGQRWLREIRGASPDLVLMLEPDDWWVEQAQPLRRDLSHAVERPIDNTYGIALYSRFPLRDVEVREVVEDSIPSIWGAFDLPSGDRVRFAFIHPRPPQVADDTDNRDAELVLVAREVEDVEGPLVVAGDFNDVAWSRTTTLFQELSGLLDPRIGRGMYSSFHAGYPPLRWPLDHAFHSDALALVEMRRLGKVGSDHFPVLAVFAIAPEAEAEQDEPDAEAEDQEEADEILDESRDGD